MVVLILLGTSLIVVASQEQVFYPGKYFSTDTININRLSKSNAGARILMDMTSLDPEELDQSQEIREGAVIIGYPWPGFCISQEAVNDRDTLLGFSVCIRTVGYTPPETFFFGIMRELADPLYAESWDACYYLENVMINSWTWLSVEFSTPMNINAGESFHIVLFSADDPLDGNCWYWGCSSEEEYHGNVHYWNYDTESWVTSSDVDMCFRTYTEEDTSPPPPPNMWLSKGITCGFAGPGCGDEGPERTHFEIGVDVYAYSKFSCSGGYDFYGKTMKHEWFYNGEKVWEWSTTCSSHYTEYWCGWTWWDIGSDLGPGQGIVKFYLDGAYMGSTNLFTVIDPNPPPPEPPSISISANSWVVIEQVSGVFCWIGAAISGFKFIK